MQKIQSVKGMKDFYGEQLQIFRYVENTAKQVLASFGYEEAAFPIVEKAQLFQGCIGDTTEIVQKEMYTFDDKGKELLSLRPEGTACCSRMAIQHGLLNQARKFFYSGPFFRRERPQQGRFRQFHQIGAETYSMEGPEIDAELIMVGEQILHTLCVGGVELRLNSLGNRACRAKYCADLVYYFSAYENLLQDEERTRLHCSPLRILDSKSVVIKDLLKNAPEITNYLDDESAEHFDRLTEILRHLGISYTLDPYLVRGLDYYSKTVFEWTVAGDKAQSAVMAGGRYDFLMEKLGGRDCPACGFALGVERLINLVSLSEVGTDTCSTLITRISPGVDIYCVSAGHEAYKTMLGHALNIHRCLTPPPIISVDSSKSSIRSQLRRANKMQAKIALIAAEQEVVANCVSVKAMTALAMVPKGEQQQIADTELIEVLQRWLHRAE